MSRHDPTGPPDEVNRYAGMVASGTGEPYTLQQPRIWDRCPSCGSRTLFVGAGGWLTCGVIDCKAPAVGEEIQALKDRVVALSEGLGREHLTLALERLRIAGEAVARGVQSDNACWWPNRAAEVAILEVRCNEASNLIARLVDLGVVAPLAGVAPHA